MTSATGTATVYHNNNSSVSRNTAVPDIRMFIREQNISGPISSVNNFFFVLFKPITSDVHIVLIRLIVQIVSTTRIRAIHVVIIFLQQNKATSCDTNVVDYV